MTRKPRSAYEDHTRKERAARRQAVLDAAAVRMGYTSWSAFETFVRGALEGAATDRGAARNLKVFMEESTKRIGEGAPNLPPADLQEIAERWPTRSPGRPPLD
jgi:hypothetical protein